MVTLNSKAQLYHGVAIVTAIIGRISEGRGRGQCSVNIDVIHMFTE